MPKLDRHPQSNIAYAVTLPRGKEALLRRWPARRGSVFDQVGYVFRVPRVYYHPKRTVESNARTKVTGVPHPAKSCSHARSRNPFRGGPEMSTPRRPRHPRGSAVAERHVPAASHVSDARATVLVQARQIQRYDLREIYARLTKNQRRQKGERLDTFLFLPQRDKICASPRGLTVSRWGVALGRRRFAMSSRTNGSHNTTRRYATAG